MSGYVDCGCRDCFEVAIGEPGALCWACEEAGCECGNGECQREGAYGELYMVQLCYADGRIEREEGAEGIPSARELEEMLRRSESDYVRVITIDGECVYD